jgi:phage tail protein X
MAELYTTSQGDKWGLIAWQMLGGTRNMNKLMAANPQYLDYYIFPAGIQLTLPGIEAEQASVSSLPPWRQVV